MNCNFHASIHITVYINMNIAITLNANGILAQLLTLMFISKLIQPSPWSVGELESELHQITKLQKTIVFAVFLAPT